MSDLGDDEKQAYLRVIKNLEQQLNSARQALHEIYEIYAGMDGFIAETCPEAYQNRTIKQMADIAGKYKHGA